MTSLAFKLDINLPITVNGLSQEKHSLSFKTFLSLYIYKKVVLIFTEEITDISHSTRKVFQSNMSESSKWKLCYKWFSPPDIENIVLYPQMIGE